jgi:hypothetical protein
MNSKDKSSQCWYQLLDGTSGEEKADILCAKWSETFLLGTSPSAAVIMKGKGLFELVDLFFASAFQNLYDTFVSEACNFIQVCWTEH